MNKKPVRRFPLVVVTRAAFLCVLMTTMPVRARPDALDDGVGRLARKAAALPHERRMSLLWTNHAALPEQRVERLRAVFAAEMETAQVKFVQGEAVPALRVTIEQTPTQIVITATIPAEGSISVAVEEVARTITGIDTVSGNTVRLEKELLWQQEAKILSAVLLPAGVNGGKRLVVLMEEALSIYGGGTGNWKVENTKMLPGPRQSPRSARGQLVVTGESDERVGVLLPGRRCEASVADESAAACANATAELPTGRLMALPSCGQQTWWLKSDGADWTEEDRLLLRNAGAGPDVTAIAELGMPGPVISISAADSGGSATVVVRDLGSGNYEVYRVALACSD